MADPTLPEAVQGWWEAFLTSRPLLPGAGVHAELTLSATLAGFRVGARFDAVRIGDQAVQIFDWKTSIHKPPRSWLGQRLQTRVYPLLLALAGEPLNGGRPVPPQQISMVYWFAQAPSEPEVFSYDGELFERDQRYLEETIGDIAAVESEQLPLTGNHKRCTLCSYRSLCGRGTRAADFEQVTDPEEELASLDIDLSQVEEIEF